MDNSVDTRRVINRPSAKQALQLDDQNMTKPDQRPTPDANADMHMALKVARIYFQNHLKDTEAQEYIATRNLSPAAMRTFEIGFAPNQWRGLVDHFSSHRLRLAAQQAGALATQGDTKRLLDFYRNRLMFPIRNHEGVLVGFGGRTLSKEDGVPKYINTPETELFNKSELLFGLFQNREQIQRSRHAILVEGYMDVISLSAAGCHLACAPMGTALTDQQFQLLVDQGVRTLWVCLDGDKAGQAATERSIGVIMAAYDPRIEVKIITIPDNDDPDSLVRSKGLMGFRECMESAERLPDVINRMCRDGKPCVSLEDKASYLMNLKPFVEQSSGSLQSELLILANQVTGLPLDDLKEATGYNIEDDLASNWHPVVANTARLLIHHYSPELATSVLAHKIKGHGYDELCELSGALLDGKAPTGNMASFAKVHGEMGEDERQHAERGFSAWARRELLSQQVERMIDAPYNRQNANDVKKTLGLR